MAAPVSFSRWFAPLGFARLPALEAPRAPWTTPARTPHGCPAPRELPGTPVQRTPRVFPAQRPPPTRTRRPVSGRNDEQLPLAVQVATRQRNCSLFYPQAPERFAGRNNFNTEPRGPSNHITNVVCHDPLAAGGNRRFQHQFIVGIGDARTHPKLDGSQFSHMTKSSPATPVHRPPSSSAQTTISCR